MIHIASLPHGDDLMAEKVGLGVVAPIYLAHEKKLISAINETVKINDFTHYRYYLCRPENDTRCGFPHTFCGTDPLRSGVTRYLTDEYESELRDQVDHEVPDVPVKFFVEALFRAPLSHGRVCDFWEKVNEYLSMSEALTAARSMEANAARMGDASARYRVHIDFPIEVENVYEEQS